MPLGYNRVLGDPAKAEAARPHRVAIASWPTMIPDPRVATLEALCGHLVASGYEGFEFSTHVYGKWFQGDSPTVVARKARKVIESFGLANFGCTLHLLDADARALKFVQKQKDEMKIQQELGCGFISYQFDLHKDYYYTAGEWREDEEYLRWCAARVSELRDAAWSLGMNFYLEVHVDRITDDPAACCRILDMCNCEVNGDISHLLARGFTRGKYVERILGNMGHTHVRMARQYGDLSAAVEDPKADWQAEGVTWQMFRFMLAGLKGGLSSRTVSGETGPMHLVRKTLDQDAALVPLYRAMARYADMSAQGMTMKVEKPDDLQPWG